MAFCFTAGCIHLLLILTPCQPKSASRGRQTWGWESRSLGQCSGEGAFRPICHCDSPTCLLIIRLSPSPEKLITPPDVVAWGARLASLMLVTDNMVEQRHPSAAEVPQGPLAPGEAGCGLAGHCSENGIDPSHADAAAGASCLPGCLVSQSHSDNWACECSHMHKERWQNERGAQIEHGSRFRSHYSVLEGARKWSKTQILPSRGLSWCGGQGKKCGGINSIHDPEVYVHGD